MGAAARDLHGEAALLQAHATYERMVAHGVQFRGEPRREPYGRVVVFSDIAGNRWDLLGPR